MVVPSSVTLLRFILLDRFTWYFFLAQLHEVLSIAFNQYESC